MERSSRKEMKMIAAAVYATNTYGTSDGVSKYNNCITDLCACKKKTLTQLKLDIDNASA